MVKLEHNGGGSSTENGGGGKKVPKTGSENENTSGGRETRIEEENAFNVQQPLTALSKSAKLELKTFEFLQLENIPHSVFIGAPLFLKRYQLKLLKLGNQKSVADLAIEPILSPLIKISESPVGILFNAPLAVADLLITFFELPFFPFVFVLNDIFLSDHKLWDGLFFGIKIADPIIIRPYEFPLFGPAVRQLINLLDIGESFRIFASMIGIFIVTILLLPAITGLSLTAIPIVGNILAKLVTVLMKLINKGVNLTSTIIH